MAVHSFEEARTHVGHDIVCVWYGEKSTPVNIAIECETCDTVLVDWDKPRKKRISK